MRSSRLFGFLVALPLAFGLQPIFERFALHPETIPTSSSVFARWNGYDYWQTTSRRVTIEGTITSISPNGGAFCSGPFAGGPGTNFTVRNGFGRKGALLTFAAFGENTVDAELHRLSEGSRVRLVATEGPVEIMRDGSVLQRVEQVGGMLSLSRQRVIDVHELQLLP